jgi:uncharacterized protein involved in cysteine biosynthesis
MGFVRGFLAPFRGGLFMSRQRLWRYLVVPLIVNAALGVGTMVAAWRFFREELAQMLSSTPVLGGIFLFVITVLGSVVLFIVLQPILSAVFCDRLAEVIEKRVRGNAPSAPFFASTGRALIHGLLKLVLYGLALLVGLALTALTGLGSLVGVGLGAIFLAFDAFDYPLARRGASFGAKWAYLAKNPGMTLGFGLGATVLYLVPLAFFVAPSFNAVGATLAYLDQDAKAAARGPRSEEAAPQSPPQAPNNPIDISAS